MTVLCDAHSIIIRRDSIDQYFEGGWKKFLETIPNNTFCTDGELARVGFLETTSAKEYVAQLESGGLQFLPKIKSFGLFGEALRRPNFVVINKYTALTFPFNWVKKKIFSLFGKSQRRDDIVVIEKYIGPTLPCNWVEFGKFPAGPNEVMVSMCWLFEGKRFGLGVHMDSPAIDLAIPEGWTPEETKNIQCSDIGSHETKYEFVRNAWGMDFYWDNETKTEVAIAELS